MHASRGGVSLHTVLDMDMVEFGEWSEAAETFIGRLNEAAKK